MSGGPTQSEREAARWVARLEARDVSLKDHRRFRQWLERAPEHRLAYEAISETWDKLDQLRGTAHVAATSTSAPAPSRRALLYWGAGAIAALGAGGLSIGLLNRQQFYQTAVGERRTIALADGSSAELNAMTRMRVQFGDNSRKLFLDAGEALLNVHRDGARPLIVTTPFGSVRATGASFVMRVSDTQSRCTMLTGSVEAMAPTGQSVSAQANEEITLSAAGAASIPLSPAIVERRLAWRDGMLAFDGETLAEAAHAVSDQTGLRFAFADPDIAALRVGGYIRASDTEAFLTLVQNNLNIRAEQHGRDVVLSR